MGWGLKVKEDVAAGTLVIEYVGEIITEAQMRVRTLNFAECDAHSNNMPPSHPFRAVAVAVAVIVAEAHVDAETADSQRPRLLHHGDREWLLRGRQAQGKPEPLHQPLLRPQLRAGGE
jgi:hypothetical protein